jgi:hypothetical protein
MVVDHERAVGFTLISLLPLFSLLLLSGFLLLLALLFVPFALLALFELLLFALLSAFPFLSLLTAFPLVPKFSLPGSTEPPVALFACFLLTIISHRITEADDALAYQWWFTGAVKGNQSVLMRQNVICLTD